ncbi:uncharacterized protein LOC128886053 [Hylaeus anthracinus]|uniref:uncharacterized protein LOC128886053 n=1 Tax=Hylaeus anthracinus TaxID=313031 RepID=UPI0023B9257D|nr:uncharacterized protein LOC128886053 [Hylaeus anthracinus]
MWYLIGSEGNRVYLHPNKELTFGRKKADILLINDESVSRLHAAISVEPRDVIKLGESTSICKLKDINSKYGTYIILGEEEKVEVSKEWYTLKDQDKIRFGLQNHIFTLVYVPIITVVSTLNDHDKEALQNLIDKIDGMISTDWTSACTHLTVSKATLTEKVTWAMASAVPIVNLDYWEKVKDAFYNAKELPESKDFVPALSESFIIKGKVSLCPNKKRKTLFQNLIFVYFSAHQYKIYGRMVNMAGGKSLLYLKKPITNKGLCASNVVVLQYSNNAATQSTQSIVSEYDSIYNILRANKRRMISESEIPLAILYCSVDKYCNPKFKFEEFLKRKESKPDTSEVLALDTQDVIQLPKVISNVPGNINIVVKKPKQTFEVIPESYDSNSDILNIDSAYQLKDSLESNASKETQQTRDDLNSTVLGTEKRVPSIEIIDDSSVPDVTLEATQCSSQKCLSSRERNFESSKLSTVANKATPFHNTNVTRKVTQCFSKESLSLEKRNSRVSKVSTVANKGTPSNEVIDLTEDNNIESRGKQLNKNKCNENLSTVLTQEKLNELLNKTNVRDDNPEVTLLPLKDCKKSSPTVEKRTSSEKRKNHFHNTESEEEHIPVRKRTSTENSDVEHRIKLSHTNGNSSSTKLPTYSSFFIRSNPTCKRFKKFHNVIPKRRITLNDMYVWNRQSV